MLAEPDRTGEKAAGGPSADFLERVGYHATVSHMTSPDLASHGDARLRLRVWGAIAATLVVVAANVVIAGL